MIEVELPDGRVIEFPDGTPPEVMTAAVQKILPPRQVARTFMQGATLGSGEEVEAGARSVLPGSPPYRETRNQIRQQIDAYRQSRPVEAFAVETMGAALPTAAAFMVPGGQPAAAANVARMANTARNLLLRGGAEGTAGGFGYSEAETLPGLAVDTATGTGVGALTSLGFGKGTQAISGLTSGLVNSVRTALGDRASTAVQAELRRLAEGTGKSMDEVVADVMEGRIMAENRTLQAAVRAYKSKGGEAGAYVTEQVPLRRAETRASAQAGLQEGLTPQTAQGNVFAAQKASDDRLRELEREDYARVFGDIPEVSPEIQGTLQDILQRLPEARTEVAKIYSNSRKLVPLFTTREDGALELVRIPTLEDAEIVRRALADETSKAYRAGSGTLAGGYEEAQTALRGQLDSTYSELQAVRQQAAMRRTVRDRFDDGRKVFNLPADELEVVVDGLRQDPAALRAFRAGAMDAIRNKMKRQQNIMGKMADPERQEGAVLRILFPEEGVDEIARRLDIAGQAEEMSNRVMFNSMTAPEQAAAGQIGSRGSLEDTARMLQGDPMALISGIQRAMAQAAPGLSDRQAMEVVKVLFSQDPDFVRRALTDDTMTAELVRRAGAVLAAGAEGGRRAAVGQAANLGTGYYEQIMGTPEGQQ